MRKLILGCNVLILFLLWLIAQVAITPADNLLVRYAETRMDLPLLTDMAIGIRIQSICVPVVWCIVTAFWGVRLRRQTGSQRSDSVLLHTVISLCLGFGMLLFFSLAGILPLLKISALID